MRYTANPGGYPHGPWLVLGVTVLLFFLGAVGVLVSYHIRFGRMIEGRMSGQPFDNISCIFAAPKRIFVGQSFSRQELAEYLRQSGYVVSPQSGGVGSVDVKNTSIEIRPSAESYFRRTNALVVRFSGTTISEIRSLENNEELGSAELEPSLLTNLFNDDSREKQRPVRFKDLPPSLIAAVLSAEDNRFFGHHGVDLVRVLGAAWVNLRQRTKAQGASTITMQTARSFFFSSKRTWRRKLEETLMALELELRFTKQQIFELYANQIYLGNRGSFAILGFGEAAHAYFDKDVRDLSLGESAFLAGIIRSPNRYTSSNCTLELVAEARDRVLSRMVGKRAISPEDARAAKQSPLRCMENTTEDSAAPHFVDMVKEQLLSRYSESELLSKRYRIYTTLDPELERAAVGAVEIKMENVDALLAHKEKGGDEMAQPAPQAQVALVALDPRTGAIKALVGGRNYGQSQLNRVLALRQPGSVFKPFVFAAAFSNAVEGLTPIVTPTTTLLDEPTTFLFNDKRYSPNNYHSEFHGTVTVREALVDSMNVATVKLAELVGYDRVAQFAQRLGMGANIQPAPLAAMGVYEMTPLEVASAYTMFANGGLRADPMLINSVVDPDGKVLELAPPNLHQVLDPRVAYLLTSLLEDVVDNGTGKGIRRDGFTGAAAGKTGTSGDGWFAGFTPNLVCVVWIGFDDDSNLKLTGAESAAPIWAELMERATSLTQYQSAGGFSAPDGVKVVDIDPVTLQVAAPFCPIKRPEVFLAGTEPTDICAEHSNPMMVQVPVDWWVSRRIDKYASTPNLEDALRLVSDARRAKIYVH